jgi:effector-binding domain-containing protein
MDHAIQEVMLASQRGISIRATVPMPDLPRFFGEAFHELETAVIAAGEHPTTPPFAQYFSVAPQGVDVEVVMPADAPLQARGRVHPVSLPGGPAVQIRHVGPYDGLAAAYRSIEGWMLMHGRKPSGPPREVYLTDPRLVPDPAHWETLVIQPIA